MTTSRRTAPRPKRRLGSVYQRKQDGRWTASITLHGQRLVRYVDPKLPPREQEKAAHELLAKLITEAGSGVITVPGEMTLGVWLDQYLKRANVGRAPSTIKDRIRNAGYLKDGLGNVRLNRLTPGHIRTWLDTAMHPAPTRKEHKKFESRPLSYRAKKQCLMLLKTALDEAVALEYMSRNVAQPVKLEKRLERHKGKAWTQEQARAFLTATEHHAHNLLWKLALQSGARIGELLALKIDDFNPDTGLLRVERTLTSTLGSATKNAVGRPKTERSRRTIPVPTDARDTIQAQLERIEKLKRSKHWEEHGWLFPSEVGTLITYDNALRAWNKGIREAQAQHPDLPRLTPHDLRRTFISLALRRGVKPEVVARIVGHTSPLITLRIYREVFDDEMQDAAERIANLV